MDSQFSSLHGNPDIVVATPGRFLHLCVEMELKMSHIQYVVFDEADRFDKSLKSFVIEFFFIANAVIYLLQTF